MTPNYQSETPKRTLVMHPSGSWGLATRNRVDSASEDPLTNEEILLIAQNSELADLRAQLAAAQRERDSLRDRDGYRENFITEIRSERDQLRAEVERLTKERDDASQVSPSEREGIMSHISSMLSDAEQEEFGLTGRQLHMLVLRVLSRLS